MSFYKSENFEQDVARAVARLQKSQPLLNAVVTEVDPQEQIDRVKALKLDGPLAGVPIVLKDNVNTKGIRTTASSRILDNYIPVYNAHIADKLAEAGAVVIAKSSMDELAMGGTNLTAYTGPVRNPWDTQRMSGGSSGGSAALVASGVVPFAIGSDTGDSVRKPAAFCGVVGVKPSYGRISRYGIIPYSSSLDHVGYFTRNIADAALALEVLAGRDDRDMTSSEEPVEHYSEELNGDLNGRRIGVLKNVAEANQNPATAGLFTEYVAKLKDAGAEIVEVEMNEALLQAILPTYYVIANCEATANHSNLDGVRYGVREEGKTLEELMIRSRTEGLSSFIRKRFVIGSYGLLDENQERLFRKAQRVRRLLVEDFQRALADVDAVIALASTNIAPPLEDHGIDSLSNTYLIAENFMVLGNFSGYPSITLPIGLVDECPIGVNVTSKAFTEKLLFDICLGMEKVSGCKDMVKEVNA